MHCVGSGSLSATDLRCKAEARLPCTEADEGSQESMVHESAPLGENIYAS